MTAWSCRRHAVRLLAMMSDNDARSKVHPPASVPALGQMNYRNARRVPFWADLPFLRFAVMLTLRGSHGQTKLIRSFHRFGSNPPI
jgi:hypothetical protein